MSPSLRQAQALPLLFESKRPLHLTAPFNAVVLKIDMATKLDRD